MQTSARSRLRSKEHTFALLAGLFVLACIFTYARRDASSFSGTAKFSTSNNNAPQLPYKLPPSVDPSITKPQSSFSSSSDGYDAPPTSDPNRIAAFPLDRPSTAPPSSPPPPHHNKASGLTETSPRAVIIETALIPNLIPLILHFATVLGPTWGVILFTQSDGYMEPRSPAFQRHLAAGRIEVRFLPADLPPLTSSVAVSRFLTAPWLWEQVAAATRVLLFQSDSVLCSRSEARVEEYFKYDYCGAPIAEQYGRGYNGGLSLRNPAVFLNVTREVDFVASGEEFEDQYFFGELEKRGAAMPVEEVAKTFAVETVYYETPLGYHQPQRWQEERMGVIEEWCPEVKMLIGRRAE